jgi:hypothetical protein
MWVITRSQGRASNGTVGRPCGRAATGKQIRPIAPPTFRTKLFNCAFQQNSHASNNPRSAATPVGVEYLIRLTPNVAAARQRWAGAGAPLGREKAHPPRTAAREKKLIREFSTTLNGHRTKTLSDQGETGELLDGRENHLSRGAERCRRVNCLAQVRDQLRLVLRWSVAATARPVDGQRLLQRSKDVGVIHDNATAVPVPKPY